MSEKSKSDRRLLRSIKELSWWTSYSLFLLIILFLLSLMIKSLAGGALGRVSNFGQLIYLVGLLIAVLGLMALCTAYILRVMWYRFKGNRGGEVQKG
jgi:hypothetical protein